MALPNHFSERRQVLKTLAVASFTSSGLWGCSSQQAHNQLIISAAKLANKHYALVAYRGDGSLAWQTPLPCRAHDVVLDENNNVSATPVGICVARRPGKVAWLFDLRDGSIVNTLTAPSAAQFNGHASFLPNAQICFTESHFFKGTAKGVIGHYHALSGERTGQYDSGGLDPHQCKYLPQQQQLVIANGGWIESQEDAFAAYLSSEKPSNLTWLDVNSGTITRQEAMTNPLASARHIDVSWQGNVVLGIQLAKPSQNPNALVNESTLASEQLVRIYRAEGGEVAVTKPSDGWQAFSRYIASVGFNDSGTSIAATSPRGNLIVAWRTDDGHRLFEQSAQDSAGLSFWQDKPIWTSGMGLIRQGTNGETIAKAALAFDNHCAVTTIQAV